MVHGLLQDMCMDAALKEAGFGTLICFLRGAQCVCVWPRIRNKKQPIVASPAFSNHPLPLPCLVQALTMSCRVYSFSFATTDLSYS